MSARYAIYYAPPVTHPLWRLGCQWLGRDAESGESLTQPAIPGPALPDITRSPRHYGFHGTLKPPFRLAEGFSEADLTAAVEALSAGTPGFDIDLIVGKLHGFLALRPALPAPDMDTLAALCVTELDHLRAPPGEAELAKRRAARLSDEQEAMLQQWGYPYVLGQFRFHLTLSERLDESTLEMLRQSFVAWAGAETFRRVPVEHIYIYRQEHRQNPFRMTHRASLRG